MWKQIPIAMVLMLLVVVCGCGDDEDCAVCPADPTDPMPTMANIWPHADGTGWIYDLEFSIHEGPEPIAEALPLPSMEELHAALQQPVATDPVSQDQGLYRTQFDGNITTDTGVVAQNLVSTLYIEVGDGLRAVPADRQAFLNDVARARPDLRSAIRERIGVVAGAAKSLDEAGFPYFLGTYAFAAEDSGYYGYGDLNTDHSWIYLDGDLSLGSTFSIQLVPDLADDIWLYGRVWSVEDREIAGATWANALESMYVVDMGVSQVTDEEGNLLGEVRSYFYGTTVFVPGVGPIACHERHVLHDDEILQDGAGGIFDFQCVIAP